MKRIHMIIKAFKPWLLIPLAAIIAIIGATVAIDAEEHTVKHLVYTDDYPALYADELDQIFGTYSLGERVEKHIEGEDCSCGYHQDTLDFYEWQITYTDACGQEMHCTINNHESIYYQQYDWLESQIKQHIFDETFFGALQPASHYLVIYIGDIVRATSGKEQWNNMETAEAFKKNLLESSDLLALSTMSYSEIFDRYPIIIGGGIRIEHQDVSADVINANMTEAVLLMEDRINRLYSEIGDNLNISMLVYTNTRDPAVAQTDVRSRYIRGVQVDPQMGSSDYDNAVYESYVGKFW